MLSVFIVIIFYYPPLLQVGVVGENLQIYKGELLDSVDWWKADFSTAQPLTWFKVHKLILHVDKGLIRL